MPMNPYHFQIFRQRAADSRKVCWFEDTEYGIVPTLKTVADMISALTDNDNPVVQIIIRKV